MNEQPERLPGTGGARRNCSLSALACSRHLTSGSRSPSRHCAAWANRLFRALDLLESLCIGMVRTIKSVLAAYLKIITES
jgi:hypothetical protein